MHPLGYSNKVFDEFPGYRTNLKLVVRIQS